MGSQIGNQKILWRYKTALIAKDLATMQHGVLYPGVYGDGLVVNLGGSGLEITAGELLINSVADDELVKIVFQDLFTIPIGAYGSGNIFAVVRFTWYDTDTNYYAEVLIKDDASLLSTDVILAVLEWNIGHTAVIGVDNTSKTYGINTHLDRVILALNPTTKLDAVRQIDVAAGNFVFSGDNIEFAGGTTASLDSSPSQRCDVIGINSSGVLVIDKGTDGSLTPNTYGAYLPVAEVKVYNNQDITLQQDITDVRPYFFFGGTVAASAVNFDDSGNTYVLGSTVQAALDAVDTELISRDTFNVRVIYFGKHGSDGNSGKSWYDAKLTLTAAITAAEGLSPLDIAWVQIICLDSGVYTLTANDTVSDYISVDMRNAELDTDAYYLSIGNAKFFARKVIKPSGTGLTAANIRFNSGVTAVLKLDGYLDEKGNTSTQCITVAGACDILIDIGETDTYGHTIYDIATGQVFVKINRAIIRKSATAHSYVYNKTTNDSDPGVFLDIGYIYGVGATYSSGIYADKHSVMANIGYIKCTGYVYNVPVGGHLHLFANVVDTGTRGVGGEIELVVGRLLPSSSASSAGNISHKVFNMSYAEIIVDRAYVAAEPNQSTNSPGYVDVTAAFITVNAPDIGLYRLYVWCQFTLGSLDNSEPIWDGYYKLHEGSTGKGLPVTFRKSSGTDIYNVTYLGSGCCILEEDIISTSVNQAITRKLRFLTSNASYSVYVNAIVMTAILVTRNSSS